MEKNILRIWKEVIPFTLILIGLLYIINSQQYLNSQSEDINIKKEQGFQFYKSDVINLFMGDSRVHYAVNPVFVNNSYNYAAS